MTVVTRTMTPAAFRTDGGSRKKRSTRRSIRFSRPISLLPLCVKVEADYPEPTGAVPTLWRMDEAPKRRVELLIPMRTLLVVAAAFALIAAFVAIGRTFLIVFVGIFLALVFEYPVRFVMRKTQWSRGLAATVTVLGSAVVVAALLVLLLVPLVGSVRDFLQQLPETVQKLRESGELSWLGDTGVGTNAQEGAEHVSRSVPDTISNVLGIAGDFFGVFLALFTILFICLFL